MEQSGVCAFVTFMTADAMPKSVASLWKEKRKRWCVHRGLSPDATPENIKDALGEAELRRFQRLVSSEYQRALDRGAGECILVWPEISGMVVSAMQFHHERSGRLFDFVVMPNHVHLLFQPHQGVSLGKVLNSIRSYSAREINKILGRKGTFWDREPFDHLVRSMHYFRRYQQYIQANPMRAGLRSDQAWLSSSRTEKFQNIG